MMRGSHLWGQGPAAMSSQQVGGGFSGDPMQHHQAYQQQQSMGAYGAYEDSRIMQQQQQQQHHQNAGANSWSASGIDVGGVSPQSSVLPQTPSITAESVGTAFAFQYFRLMKQRPDELYRFYSFDSTLSRGYPTSTGFLDVRHANGALRIREYLYKEFRTQMALAVAILSSVVSHFSENGSVFVQITGELRLVDDSVHPFAQAVWLKQQDSVGYYVRNDILTYSKTCPARLCMPEDEGPAVAAAAELSAASTVATPAPPLHQVQTGISTPVYATEASTATAFQRKYQHVAPTAAAVAASRLASHRTPDPVSAPVAPSGHPSAGPLPVTTAPQLVGSSGFFHQQQQQQHARMMTVSAPELAPVSTMDLSYGGGSSKLNESATSSLSSAMPHLMTGSARIPPAIEVPFAHGLTAPPSTESLSYVIPARSQQQVVVDHMPSYRSRGGHDGTTNQQMRKASFGDDQIAYQQRHMAGGASGSGELSHVTAVQPPVQQQQQEQQQMRPMSQPQQPTPATTTSPAPPLETEYVQQSQPEPPVHQRQHVSRSSEKIQGARVDVYEERRESTEAVTPSAAAAMTPAEEPSADSPQEEDSEEVQPGEVGGEEDSSQELATPAPVSPENDDSLGAEGDEGKGDASDEEQTHLPPSQDSTPHEEEDEEGQQLPTHQTEEQASEEPVIAPEEEQESPVSREMSAPQEPDEGAYGEDEVSEERPAEEAAEHDTEENSGAEAPEAEEHETSPPAAVEEQREPQHQEEIPETFKVREAATPAPGPKVADRAPSQNAVRQSSPQQPLAQQPPPVVQQPQAQQQAAAKPRPPVVRYPQVDPSKYAPNTYAGRLMMGGWKMPCQIGYAVPPARTSQRPVTAAPRPTSPPAAATAPPESSASPESAAVNSASRDGPPFPRVQPAPGRSVWISYLPPEMPDETINAVVAGRLMELNASPQDGDYSAVTSAVTRIIRIRGQVYGFLELDCESSAGALVQARTLILQGRPVAMDWPNNNSVRRSGSGPATSRSPPSSGAGGFSGTQSQRAGGDYSRGPRMAGGRGFGGQQQREGSNYNNNNNTTSPMMRQQTAPLQPPPSLTSRSVVVVQPATAAQTAEEGADEGQWQSATRRRRGNNSAAYNRNAANSVPTRTPYNNSGAPYRNNNGSSLRQQASSQVPPVAS